MAVMPSDDLAARIRTASRSCPDAVSGQVFRSPAQAFADLARSRAELGIEEWDFYGESGPVERLEAELVELFGVEAAAFFPSGIMAQQVALRVHTDRAGIRRVALPDLSHLLLHEEDGPRLLHGLEISILTRGFEAPAARHLEAIPGRLGAVLAELPLREAGCLLPAWDDLAELSQACRARGVVLHFDGARIWESQPWFGVRYRRSQRSPTRSTSRSTRGSAAWPALPCSVRPASSRRRGCGGAVRAAPSTT